MQFLVRSLLPGLFVVLFGVLPARSDDSRGLPRSEEGPSVHIEKVEVGFQGIYKVGEWAPLWVTLHASTACRVQIVVDAPDPDDNMTSLPGRFEDLKSGLRKRLETCFRTGRMHGDLQVAVHDSEGRTLATRRLRPTARAGSADGSPEGDDASSDLRPAVRLDSPVWVTLGKFDLARSFAESATAGTQWTGANPDTAHDPHLPRLESLGQIPAESRALQSVDMLILPTGRLAGGGDSLLNQMTAGQDAVLQAWVRMGGHLLISVGAETAAYEKSLLARWVPIKVDGQSPLRQLSGFESYTGRNAPMKVGTIPSARLENVQRANVLLSDAGNPHPLVASLPWGFGRVTFVAVDIDQPPLSNWPALKFALQKFDRGGAGASKTAVRRMNQQLTHVGVTDLATQFQFSTEDFSSIRRPSYWWVMGLILLYVAVIGPLDYLLVHRLLRRPELTWVTFPILMGASIAAAAWYADRINGRALQVNQFDLVDIDSTTGTVRNNTWVSLYSPRQERFSVAVEPSANTQFGKSDGGSAAVRLSWMGVPENSVGGMYRSGGASFGSRGYRFGVAARAVENLPVAHWSTKTLSAVWRTELTQPVVDSRLENLGPGQLRGAITLHLDVPLEDCLVVASGWAYIPTTAGATLLPGVEWVLKGDKGVRHLRALLTSEKLTRLDKQAGSVGSEFMTTSEAYNPLGRDLDQQIRMISFHETVGGSEYTGLAHAALRGLELTDLMQLGRAILIGRVASSPARVLVDGAAIEPADHSTWVRLVLPVAQSRGLPDKFIPKASETGIEP